MRSVGLKPWHPFRSERARERYLAYYDAQAERCWPSTVTMLDTEHGKTLVRSAGPQGAPPLVLLPPRTGHSANTWGRIIGALSRDYRVHALDSIYDFGRSANAGPASGVGDYPRWIGEVLDGLGLVRDVNLLGFSRGAWMAAEYLVHAPERLRRVVWLSPGALLLPYSLTPSAILGLPMLVAPSPYTVRLGTRDMMPGASSSSGASREEYEQFVEDMAIGLRCFDLGRLDFMRIERVLEDEELRAIEVPVLYLAGELERMYSARAGAARLERVAPRIERCVVPGAGHDLVSLKPEVVIDRILRFLE